jgi:hypothetical protein
MRCVHGMLLVNGCEICKAVLAERERCAKVAENWGYTYNEDKRQPFAAEFNHKLRAQNKAIADKIRKGEQ